MPTWAKNAVSRPEREREMLTVTTLHKVLHAVGLLRLSVTPEHAWAPHTACGHASTSTSTSTVCSHA